MVLLNGGTRRPLLDDQPLATVVVPRSSQVSHHLLPPLHDLRTRGAAIASMGGFPLGELSFFLCFFPAKVRNPRGSVPELAQARG